MEPTGTFKSQQAPVGKAMDGERYEDRDEHALLTEELCYAC